MVHTRAQPVGFFFKETHGGLSVSLWSSLLEINIWKSQKLSAILFLAVCVFDVGNKASICSWSVFYSIASWANLFVLFIGTDQTNMTVPLRGQIQSKNKKSTPVT